MLPEEKRELSDGKDVGLLGRIGKALGFGGGL
jgi:hypothetical protein